MTAYSFVGSLILQLRTRRDKARLIGVAGKRIGDDRATANQRGNLARMGLCVGERTTIGPVSGVVDIVVTILDSIPS